MRLLTEIIELLSSNAPDLENALFKAQVLAHRLGEIDMKEWVGHELKGYPSRDALPPYRVLPVTVMANLSNGCCHCDSSRGRAPPVISRRHFADP